MGSKSDRKRRYILEKAKEVFCKKGFKEVTMQDVVSECEISRGGLYLYFQSTEEIFLEVLKMESEDSDDVFSNAIKDDSTSADILALFLKEQKKEILDKKPKLTIAIYEYFFANQLPKKENPMKQQFDVAVKIIEKLISDGVENGEFSCDDPRGTARNIMYVLEGLKVSAQTMGITEDAVNKEILYVLSNLIVEE